MMIILNQPRIIATRLATEIEIAQKQITQDLSEADHPSYITKLKLDNICGHLPPIIRMIVKQHLKVSDFLGGQPKDRAIVHLTVGSFIINFTLSQQNIIHYWSMDYNIEQVNKTEACSGLYSTNLIAIVSKPPMHCNAPTSR